VTKSPASACTNKAKSVTSLLTTFQKSIAITSPTLSSSLCHNPNQPTKTMKTYSFTTNQPLELHAAFAVTQRWARRRPFPVRIVSVSPHRVSVELQAADNGQHNRAVDSLGRILEKQLDRLHFLQSSLVHTANLKEGLAIATHYQA
jgi:hypothetical protein